MRNYCMKCHKEYPLERVIHTDSVPRCECGGIIKPDVVLYNEPLNSDALKNAIEYIRQANLLIIGGTSLNVYPAAGLIEFADKTLLINKDRTSKDIILVG